MRWLLVERKPDIVYAGAEDVYLGKDGAETGDANRALTFATREEAEAHRRTLKRRYDWVAMSSKS
jgi:hypothetical protein